LHIEREVSCFCGSAEEFEIIGVKRSSPTNTHTQKKMLLVPLIKGNLLMYPLAAFFYRE